VPSPSPFPPPEGDSAVGGVQCEAKCGAIDMFSVRYYFQRPTSLARAFLHTLTPSQRGTVRLERVDGEAKCGAI
jgi:hypothetical protein